MARIWRTNDGRHVPDGHPDAAFLAYGPNDSPPADVLAEVEGRSVARSAAKRRRGTTDKQADAGEDKGGGVTINRLADQPEA